MFTFTADTAALQARLKALAEAKEAKRYWAQHAVAELSEQIRENIKAKGGEPGIPVEGNEIGDRSGRLRTALTPGGTGNILREDDKKNRFIAVFGVQRSVVPYWAVHEYGATITAKRAKYLTIPMSRAAAATKARDVPGLRLLVSKAGKLFLVTGEPGSLTFWYRLKRSVFIPKRPYVAPALIQFYGRRLPKLLQSMRFIMIAVWRRG